MIFTTLFSLIVVLEVVTLVNSQESTFFTDDCLVAHNQYRTEYGARPLEVDKELVALASSRADKMASDGLKPDEQFTREHEVGEIIDSFTKERDTSCDAILKSWMNTASRYDYDHPSFSEATAKFTQMVWKDSKKVGCAISISDRDNASYVACEYSPPGNFAGSFAQNVGKRVP